MLIITPPPAEKPEPIAHNGTLAGLTAGELDLVNAKYYKKATPFVLALWAMIQEADACNMDLIKQVYPHHVEAWLAYKRIPSWWDDLVAKIPQGRQRRADDLK